MVKVKLKKAVEIVSMDAISCYDIAGEPVKGSMPVLAVA
jgi:hypothetical protein